MDLNALLFYRKNHIRYTCINFHSFVLFGSKMTTGLILFLQSNQSASSKIPFTFFVMFNINTIQSICMGYWTTCILSDREAINTVLDDGIHTQGSATIYCEYKSKLQK